MSLDMWPSPLYRREKEYKRVTVVAALPQPAQSVRVTHDDWSSSIHAPGLSAILSRTICREDQSCTDAVARVMVAAAGSGGAPSDYRTRLANDIASTGGSRVAPDSSDLIIRLSPMCDLLIRQAQLTYLCMAAGAVVISWVYS